MNQEYYMNIERLKPSFSDSFEKGDFIVVQEKIDGANFSCRYDKNTNTIKSFSRKKELDFKNNLRGAYEWSQKLDVDLFHKVMGDTLILFMEWLVKHTVVYPQDKYQNAYCYDIYDTETCQYLTQDIVKTKVEKLGLIYVPVFYQGEFTNWDDLKQYIGKTELGAKIGEGIVVKNQTKLKNPNTRLPFYTKLVSEEFCETKAHKNRKPIDMDKLAEKEKIRTITETIVTKARVKKIINKMVDDKIIPEDWGSSHMKIIAKNLGKEIYNDCVKEEPDTVYSINDFGKYAASTAMKIARNILNRI